MAVAVGIDLGTTNSVIAVFQDGHPIVIANEEGLRTTPSVVAIGSRGEHLVGEVAQRQAILNPKGTISSAKRFIGRRYSEVSGDLNAFSFDVTAGPDDTVKFTIGGKQYAPEEISADVLAKLVKDASDFLGEQITEAVITVPAYFNDAQRQATKYAGAIAGLKVLRVINEPTAAALAYGFDKRKKKTVLVFDMGGGTFDVSVLAISGDDGDDGGLIQVIGTGGNPRLGGDDFDWRLARHLADEFERQHRIDLREDPKQSRRLVQAAETAKKDLSSASRTGIYVPNIAPPGIDLDTSLLRTEFEDLAGELIERCRQPVEQALADAKATPADIDEVILVGGSTRIPAVENLVRRLIGKEPCKTVNPDEVVAVGAAIQAAIIQGDVTDTLLIDITPLSLGIETYGGIFAKLIKRNSVIPTKRSEIFTTAEDNQATITIQVFQGEREITAHNNKLGTFELPGIAPAPRGTPQINVAFDIDADSIVHVSAKDLGTGTERNITITDSSTLKFAEVEKMIADAKRHRREDAQLREKIKALDELSYRVRRRLRDLGGAVAPGVRARAESLVADATQALNGNAPVKRIDYLTLRLQQSDSSLNGPG